MFHNMNHSLSPWKDALEGIRNETQVTSSHKASNVIVAYGPEAGNIPKILEIVSNNKKASYEINDDVLPRSLSRALQLSSKSVSLLSVGYRFLKLRNLERSEGEESLNTSLIWGVNGCESLCKSLCNSLRALKCVTPLYVLALSWRDVKNWPGQIHEQLKFFQEISSFSSSRLNEHETKENGNDNNNLSQPSTKDSCRLPIIFLLLHAEEIMNISYNLRLREAQIIFIQQYLRCMGLNFISSFASASLEEASTFRTFYNCVYDFFCEKGTRANESYKSAEFAQIEKLFIPFSWDTEKRIEILNHEFPTNEISLMWKNSLSFNEDSESSLRKLKTYYEEKCRIKTEKASDGKENLTLEPFQDFLMKNYSTMSIDETKDKIDAHEGTPYRSPEINYAFNAQLSSERRSIASPYQRELKSGSPGEMNSSSLLSTPSPLQSRGIPATAEFGEIEERMDSQKLASFFQGLLNREKKHSKGH